MVEVGLISSLKGTCSMSWKGMQSFVMHAGRAGLRKRLLLRSSELDLSRSNDNFRMNTGYGRYGATYNMVGISCFNQELLLLPKNPTEAKLQATSTWGESTEPTKGVMKHTYKVVLYNYCLMQYCCILFYQLVCREGCIPNQREKVSKSMNSSSIGNR
jgi:hypothetical protein